MYTSRDVGAALRVAEPGATLVHLPLRTGTSADRDLGRHLTEDVLPHLPEDLTFRRVSRTVDQRGLVQESVVSFTHDRELPWLLPGVPPTHRSAEVTAMTTLRVKHRSHMGASTTVLLGQRVLWDLASLLAQLDLTTLPVVLPARAVAAGGS